MEYTLDKKQVPRLNGTPQEDYIVSPYATIWNNERYYMVGYSEKRQAVNTYHVDRMSGVKQISRKRHPAPEDFNIQDYTDKVFWMYKGDEENVTLRCKQHLMDQMIDKFGEGIDIENVQEDTFDITVPVEITGTFYAWVTQYVGEMKIVAPEHVREAYKGYLREAIDDMSE